MSTDVPLFELVAPPLSYVPSRRLLYVFCFFFCLVLYQVCCRSFIIITRTFESHLNMPSVCEIHVP